MGTVRLGVDEYGNATGVLQFLKDSNLFLTLEMLTTSEFKLKDSAGTGTTALLFTDKNGNTDKGWVGKYDGGEFTVKSNTGELVLDSGSGSTLNIENNSFYPSSDYQWALGKDGNRWTTVYCSSVNQTSDQRLKENINYLAESPTSATDTSITLDDLYKFINTDLKLSTYDYKEAVNLNADERQNLQGKLGFIAQDLQTTAVGKSVLIEPKIKDGYLAYDLNNYVNVIAGALQKTIHKVENMNAINQLTAMSSIRSQAIGNQISQLMMQNLQLQGKITELESKVNGLTATKGTVAPQNNTTNGGNTNGTN